MTKMLEFPKRKSNGSMPEKLEQDVLIAVIGSPGCGKSTFINTLIGRPVATVYHGLKSGPSTVQQFSLYDPQYPMHRIVLIDTPGFDNASMDNEAILQLITQWLSKSYEAATKVSGVIYLHDITKRRLPQPGLYDAVFKQLCGSDRWPSKVVLATTMWDDVPVRVGEAREQDLREEYWKPMLKSGSRMARFDGTRPSARELVLPFLGMTNSQAPQEPREKKLRRAFTFPPFLPRRIRFFHKLRAMF